MKWMGFYATFVHIYRLNWAWRTSWEWWYEWGDTALQTHDSKLSPVGLRRVNSRSWNCPQYSIFTIEQRGNILFFETWMPEHETNLRSLTFQAGTRAPALWYCCYIYEHITWLLISRWCAMYFAGIYKLISKTVPIIDFYDIDDVLYWFKYIFFSVFICVVTVVKTHLCSCFPHDG